MRSIMRHRWLSGKRMPDDMPNRVPNGVYDRSGDSMLDRVSNRMRIIMSSRRANLHRIMPDSMPICVYNRVHKQQYIVLYFVPGLMYNGRMHNLSNWMPNRRRGVFCVLSKHMHVRLPSTMSIRILSDILHGYGDRPKLFQLY